MIINKKFTENEPPKELDYEEYPDGIDDPKITDYLVSRDSGHVWKNGFQLKVEDGTWYEVYFKDRAHEDGSECDKELNNGEETLIRTLSSLYKGSDFGLFAPYGQITFYVSDKEELLDEDLLLSSFEKINIAMIATLSPLNSLILQLKKAKDDGLDGGKAKIIAKCKEDLFGLRDAPDKFKADKEVVMAAVAAWGQAFEYASDELKADKDFIMEVIKKTALHPEWDEESRGVLQFVSEELKADKEVVMAAVAAWSWAFEYASDELKADKDFVMTAVKVDKSVAFKFAAEELKADKEVVMAAVETMGGLLSDASDELKADKEVVMATFLTAYNPIDGFKYASEELKADKEVVMAAVKVQFDGHGYSGNLQYASEELKADKEVVMAAVENDGRALKYVSDELKADKEVVMAAVKCDGNALEHADESLQNDKDLIAAVG